MQKFRVAGVPLAGLLLLGLALPAQAGFFSPCKPDCCAPTTEVVRVPGHEIVVETARPQVVVNESRVVHAKPHRVVTAVPVQQAMPMQAVPMQAMAPAPMVATIFTPMAAAPLAAPLAAAPTVSTMMACPPPARERTSLDALRDMEYHQLEVKKLHAAQQIELAHAQQVFQRMSTSLQAGLGGIQLGDSTVQSDLAKEVARLRDLVNGGSDRTTRLEGVIKELQQLTITHDEVIKQKVLQGVGSAGGGDLKRIEDMIKELQKLVLRHDDILRDLVRQRAAPLPPGPPAMVPAGH